MSTASRCRTRWGPGWVGIRGPSVSKLRHFYNTAHRYERSHVDYRNCAILINIERTSSSELLALFKDHSDRRPTNTSHLSITHAVTIDQSTDWLNSRMNITSSGTQIRAWTAVGAMTVGAIFDRFDRDIIDSPPFSTEELSALERKFQTVCDNNGHVSKAAFTVLFKSQSNLPSSLTEAASVLFDSLCYLSTAPLQIASPPSDYLTLKGLKRALIWCFPDKTLSAITMTSGYRERSPADHRRLIFQSLAATTYQFGVPSFDKRFARALAIENSRDFPPDHRGGPVEDADVNFDDDGDEMFHDVLDFLASTQPYVPPTYAKPCRDGFRDLAKKLHKDAPSLSNLVIPQGRLEAFISMLLAINLQNRVGGRIVDTELELQGVAQSIAACFQQPPSLEVHAFSSDEACSSRPVVEATWPMFNFAISKLLVCYLCQKTHEFFTDLNSLTSSTRSILHYPWSSSISHVDLMPTRGTFSLVRFLRSLVWSNWKMFYSTQSACLRFADSNVTKVPLNWSILSKTFASALYLSFLVTQ